MLRTDELDARDLHQLSNRIRELQNFFAYMTALIHNRVKHFQRRCLGLRNRLVFNCRQVLHYI